MKVIKLTQGKFVTVDYDRHSELAKYGWCFDKSNGYAVATIKKKKTFMHRFILDAKKGEFCDHINMDKLDNRVCNLRVVSHSENMRNRTKQKNNTSGFKGVSWNGQRKEYDVRIGVNNKQVWIGYFKDLGIAVQAYDEAALKYHGEFARVNTL